MTKRVGFFTTIDNIVISGNNTFVDNIVPITGPTLTRDNHDIININNENDLNKKGWITTGTIVFDEGQNAGSEIVFGGYGSSILPDYAITGGIGNFVGVSGDVYFRGQVGSITINCHSVVVGGRENVASGFDSTIGGGVANNAKGDSSVIIGGEKNNAAGDFSVVLGGNMNKAGGDNSIAMGTNANAKKDRSMVINLGKEKATSTKKGEFLVSSNVITFQIGTKKASINEKNFNKFFKKVLKENQDDGRRHLEDYTINDGDQQANIIKELHSQVDEQQAQIEQQQAHIEKQQEQINELYGMMTVLSEN